MNNNENYSYRILSLQAKDLIDITYLNPNATYTYKQADGSINESKFTSIFDQCLDMYEMLRIRKNKLGFYIGENKYSVDIINVNFDYSFYEFNKIWDNIYVKAGYQGEKKLNDGVRFENGELVAIQLDKEFTTLVDPSLIAPYFKIVGNKYKEAKNDVIYTKKDLRKMLYDNGFTCENIHYSRYKRSAGSSRDGHCLFIADDILKKMMKWSLCGINPNSKKVNDKRVSFEAYNSLSLSTIDGTIDIPLNSILLIDDKYSVFKERVINVDINKKDLESKEDIVEVTNNIWDGEALLDSSIFDNNNSSKGMMLLRNRFFKTCAFNTNLKSWFKDNNIKSISQLNGETSATKVSDIKLVITRSSLKYLSFGTFQEWKDNVSSTFGVVKTEKPTHFFDGDMVRTNYQFLNTLELTKEEVSSLLKPSAEYRQYIYDDIDVLKFHIDFGYESKYMFDEDDDDEYYRNEITFNMLHHNIDFADTEIFKEFRKSLITSMRNHFLKGKLLVDGTNATLFGNGYELLLEIIKKNTSPITSQSLGVGEVYTKAFKDKEEIVCCRSPHITMGNIYLAKNNQVKNISKYFNLTREIICVNAIGDNIQQRLNGCDYDSDSMLVTNNDIIRSSVKKNYDKFLVPYCSAKPIEKIKSKDLAEIDQLICDNLIGEIVNNSQVLNSILWHKINNKADSSSINRIYEDICKLAVLSGMEIDKAKRPYDVDAKKIVDEMKNEANILGKEYLGENIKLGRKSVKPSFFYYVNESDLDSDDPSYIKFDTTMNYLIDSIKDIKRVRSKRTVKLSDLFVDLPQGVYFQNDHKKKFKMIVERCEKAYDEITSLRTKLRLNESINKSLIYARIREKQSNCLDDVRKYFQNEKIVHYTLKYIDGVESMGVIWLLLYCLYYSARYTVDSLYVPGNFSYYKIKSCDEDEYFISREDRRYKFFNHYYKKYKIIGNLV